MYMNSYLNDIISKIENFGEKYEFMINNFKTIYILIILVYVACIFILISQHNINKKLDRILLDKDKSAKISAADSKLSKLLVDLVLSVLSVIFIIIILLSLK